MKTTILSGIILSMFSALLPSAIAGSLSQQAIQNAGEMLQPNRLPSKAMLEAQIKNLRDRQEQLTRRIREFEDGGPVALSDYELNQRYEQLYPELAQLEKDLPRLKMELRAFFNTNSTPKQVEVRNQIATAFQKIDNQIKAVKSSLFLALQSAEEIKVIQGRGVILRDNYSEIAPLAPVIDSLQALYDQIPSQAFELLRPRIDGYSRNQYRGCVPDVFLCEGYGENWFVAIAPTPSRDVVSSAVALFPVGKLNPNGYYHTILRNNIELPEDLSGFEEWDSGSKGRYWWKVNPVGEENLDVIVYSLVDGVGSLLTLHYMPGEGAPAPVLLRRNLGRIFVDYAAPNHHYSTLLFGAPWFGAGKTLYRSDKNFPLWRSPDGKTYLVYQDTAVELENIPEIGAVAGRRDSVSLLPFDVKPCSVPDGIEKRFFFRQNPENPLQIEFYAGSRRNIAFFSRTVFTLLPAAKEAVEIREVEASRGSMEYMHSDLPARIRQFSFDRKEHRLDGGWFTARAIAKDGVLTIALHDRDGVAMTRKFAIPAGATGWNLCDSVLTYARSGDASEGRAWSEEINGGNLIIAVPPVENGGMKSGMSTRKWVVSWRFSEGDYTFSNPGFSTECNDNQNYWYTDSSLRRDDPRERSYVLPDGTILWSGTFALRTRLLEALPPDVETALAAAPFAEIIKKGGLLYSKKQNGDEVEMRIFSIPPVPREFGTREITEQIFRYRDGLAEPEAVKVPVPLPVLNAARATSNLWSKIPPEPAAQTGKELEARLNELAQKETRLWEQYDKKMNLLQLQAAANAVHKHIGKIPPYLEENRIRNCNNYAFFEFMAKELALLTEPYFEQFRNEREALLAEQAACRRALLQHPLADSPTVAKTATVKALEGEPNDIEEPLRLGEPFEFNSILYGDCGPKLVQISYRPYPYGEKSLFRSGLGIRCKEDNAAETLLFFLPFSGYSRIQFTAEPDCWLPGDFFDGNELQEGSTAAQCRTFGKHVFAAVLAPVENPDEVGRLVLYHLQSSTGRATRITAVFY